MDIHSLLKEALTASDRSAAILLASFVERILEFTISRLLPNQDEATLKALKGRDGPLNGFFSKIYLAYAMGIIPDYIRDELDAIRRIRNTFAHSALRINFETPAIMEECKKFKRIDLSGQDEDGDLRKFMNLSEPRSAFSLTCFTCFLFLLFRVSNPKILDPLATSDEIKRELEETNKLLNATAKRT